MENLGNRVNGNAISAAQWNQPPNEIQNVITQAGISLTSADVEQLGQAISALGMGNAYYIDTGAADVYVVDPVAGRQGADVYIDGMFVIFRADNASTGTATATVTVNGIAGGAKNIKREDGTDLLVNDIRSGRDAWFRYDDASGTFLLQDFSILLDATTALPPNHLTGFQHRISTTGDPVDDIDVLVGGVCRDSTDAQNIVGTALTKRIDETWVAGDDAGGMNDTEHAVSDDTWYRLFVLSSLAGVIDYGWDTSATAANLIADTAVIAALGATGVKFRQIAWTRRGTALNILYVQNPDDLDEIDWDVPFLDDSNAPTTTATSITILAPPDSTAQIVTLYEGDAAADADVFGLVTALTQTDTAPSATIYNTGGQRELSGGSLGIQSFAGPMNVALDASSQLRSRWSVTTGNLELVTKGFRYRRGKL